MRQHTTIYCSIRALRVPPADPTNDLHVLILFYTGVFQKESVVKRSVAELAGKFACQSDVPKGPEGNKPVRRRPPRSLPLPASNDAAQNQDEQQKGEVTSHPPRKQRNSALIEKLQANLALSPSGLLPSPLSPGATKPPVLTFSPDSPCSPAGPAVAPKPSKEAPASFEKPAEGTVLQSINKGRARHSIKRRPPSRRHRKSSSDDVGTEEEKTTSPVSESSAPGGKEEDVFEKQKVEEKKDGSAEPAPSTSEEQTEPNQSASPDSEQKPTPEENMETKACEEVPVSSEKEEKIEEEEKKPDEPHLANSTSETIQQEEPHEEPATEPESEPAKAVEGKEDQEEKKEDEGESQTEDCKDSEQ
ncbi:hypothetical protein NFI96_017411 [Prochilodus magdalenae]|nr:hypothetical protein NFI96_017411 [Prochilodus magdalenae]